MSTSDEVYDELMAYTALKMNQWRTILSDINEIETAEENLITEARGAIDGDVEAVRDQINDYRDQVLCLMIELEDIWSEMHAHRVSLMVRYRDLLISEM